MPDIVRHVERMPISSAIHWELHKETLSWALVDAACEVAREKGLLKTDEEQAEVTTEGGNFVITVTEWEAPR